MLSENNMQRAYFYIDSKLNLIIILLILQLVLLRFLELQEEAL
jgi:hypothetical protein